MIFSFPPPIGGFCGIIFLPRLGQRKGDGHIDQTFDDARFSAHSCGYCIGRGWQANTAKVRRCFKKRCIGIVEKERKLFAQSVQ